TLGYMQSGNIRGSGRRRTAIRLRGEKSDDDGSRIVLPDGDSEHGAVVVVDDDGKLSKRLTIK
ncbi:hypothetical protein KGQ27_03895, partial [Patescibacteria group bacterium]|nr:hypothetical protein [Patescibacteria group bacterium]MDE2011227.1 hypothetical protein [Patescibacteria group bacterium]